MTTAVLNQLAEIQRMPTPDLRALWRKLYEREPPQYNRLFLVARLSYRVQEIAFGGLKPETVKELEALGKGLDGGSVNKRRLRADWRPPSGTRLIREWRGVEHTVTVHLLDYEWQGRRYKHLTPIARAIAGTNYNGLVFFGLKKQGKSL